MTNTGGQAAAIQELGKLCVHGADQQEKGCTKKQCTEDGDLTVCNSLLPSSIGPLNSSNRFFI